MPITMEQVRQLLLPEEPNYPAAARRGPELLPHLGVLTGGPDALLASKAAYLAGLIDHDAAAEVVGRAARNPSPVVRGAAAAAAGNVMRPAAAGVLMVLLSDRDLGVRKVAIKSAAARPNPALLAKLTEISERDPALALRQLAAQVLAQVRTGAG